MKKLKTKIAFLTAGAVLSGTIFSVASAATPNYLSLAQVKKLGIPYETWGNNSYSYVQVGPYGYKDPYIHFGSFSDYEATWSHKATPISGGKDVGEFLSNNANGFIENIGSYLAMYYCWLRYSSHGQMDIAKIKLKTMTECFYGNHLDHIQ